MQGTIVRMGACTIRPPSYKELQKTAICAAHAAGRVLMRRFRKKLNVSEKPGAGLVTNADLESERAALRVLKRQFPHFGILTEESPYKKSDSPGRWILDPLDGTTNFARGLSTFCVSIAAEWDGQVVVGVVYHPVLNETYTAVRGKGAFVNGKRMKVSGVSKLRDAVLSTGFCSRKELWLKKELPAFERLSFAAQGIRRPGSAALDLAYVARGSFDGFWERGLSVWDVAAGSLLIEEAGGSITDFSGSVLSLDSGEVFASNGTLHEALLREANLKNRRKNSYRNERRKLPRSIKSRPVEINI